MKIASVYTILVLAVLGPTPLFAQQLESWLSSVKREVARLGINERGFLQSVNRLRNSVVQKEDLFFVSSMQFEELDIQLFPDGSARVLNGNSYINSSDIDRGTIEEGSSKRCDRNLSEQPRLSLASTSDSLPINRSSSDLTSSELNSLAFLEHYIEDLMLIEENIALSPFSDNQSRYENILRGSHFEESKHKVSYSVELSELGEPQWWSDLDPRRLVSKWQNGQRLKISLMILDDGETKKEAVYSYRLFDNDLESVATGARSRNATLFMDKLAREVKDFVLSAQCVVTHSNIAVASNGRLLLESGSDAGLREGDQLLILPKSKYFRKRGLLAGVNRIAIVRVSEISALRSVLELEEGGVDFEEGTEYVARPLLELI